MKAPANKPSVPLKQKEDLANLQKPKASEFPAFKSGSALPSVSDKENSKKPTVKFQDNLDDYDEEEASDFDANELLDMTDYKNKRGIPSPADIASIKPNPANAKFPATAQSKFPPPAPQKATPVADEAWELEDEDGDDGWGEDSMEDLKKFDYKNTDLNKMSDYQIKRHKENMDKEFAKKVLKPGDKGFEYDKRVDFSS